MTRTGNRRKPNNPISVTLTLDEADEIGLNLMNTKEAAYKTGTSKNMVIYWAARGYINKYYVYGNTYNYLVDYEEVRIQPELGYDRKHTAYNFNAHLQPRSADGRRWVKREETEVK